MIKNTKNKKERWFLSLSFWHSTNTWESELNAKQCTLGMELSQLSEEDCRYQTNVLNSWEMELQFIFDNLSMFYFEWKTSGNWGYVLKLTRTLRLIDSRTVSLF